MNSSNKFTEHTNDGKKAFEAYVAIWQMSPSQHIAIAAPTLDKLKIAWAVATGHDNLITEHAQHVLITQFP